MKPTPLLFCSLCFLILPFACVASPEALAGAEAALRSAQQRYEEEQVPYSTVLEAEYHWLLCRAETGDGSAEELLPLLDSLYLRQEEYLTRCLAGGVLDKQSLNGARINLLSFRCALEHKAGRPTEETRARLRALYEENLAMKERLYQSGLVPMGELESARRALETFLSAE